MPDYARNTLTWDEDTLRVLAAADLAQAFTVPDGVAWVVKTEQGIYAVRPHQVTPGSTLARLRDRIVDHDTEVDYLIAVANHADKYNISVEDLTEGEYTQDSDGWVHLVEY